MEEKDFLDPVRLWSVDRTLIGYLTAYRAAEMVNEGRHKRINKRAIEEVSE